MQSNAKLSKTQSPSTDEEIADMSRVPYASAVGSIMYAMTRTRPDVAFALSMVSRYQGNPGRAHWTAVKNILKYLHKTKNFVLVLGGSDTLRVDGYTDASFQTDRDNVSEAAKEAAWLKNFIGDLGVVPSIQEPVELFCDNEGAVALTKEPRDHGKSRHIDRKYHYIRHKVEEGHLVVKRVSSEDNPADPLTKALSRSLMLLRETKLTWSIGSLKVICKSEIGKQRIRQGLILIHVLIVLPRRGFKLIQDRTTEQVI
ncbi:hypothetical protein L2E82_25700 [Cichorium intybus]|uniref:Uncharacterized protein n=1 Tax=Cichorium intybus TaxID=13427 RepID=A0ACB9E5C0_CICIN|nr:hypothetical protein L2E82_25700 [Cichorium intybus]